MTRHARSPLVTVRPGEEVQLRCRDALDIGDQARTLTADGSMTLDDVAPHEDET